jgi:hypothetical protein
MAKPFAVRRAAHKSDNSVSMRCQTASTAVAGACDWQVTWKDPDNAAEVTDVFSSGHGS